MTNRAIPSPLTGMAEDSGRAYIEIDGLIAEMADEERARLDDLFAKQSRNG